MRTRFIWWGGAVIVAAVLTGRAAADDVTVTVDLSVTYQTIRGWSANPWYPQIAPRLRDQLLDDAVNELGLTRLRWGQHNGNRAIGRSWEWLNDDGDPTHVNWPAFETALEDEQIKRWVLPFKERVEKNGDPFELWVSPSFFDGGSTGSAPAWILHSPGEYAEFATSFLTYLKEKHGVEATHYVILNEAGNNNPFSPEVVRQMIRALGPRLEALGLKTTIQFSDGVNAGVTWRYIQATRNDAEMWKYVTHLSYHLYGAKDPFREQIRDLARERGLVTGQTEFMHLTMNDLYDDVTKGGVSYWSIYGLAGPGQGQNYRLHLSNTAFTRGPQFWNFRQVMRYVRPGAVRVDAKSSDAALRVLAFARDGRATVVLINDQPPHQARTVTVKGLPAGFYGVCRSVARRVYEEVGPETVGADGALAVQVPRDAVLTIYPRSAKNLPPTVTAWEARPVYLTVPASRTTLSAAAVDPDRDQLSFEWRVTQAPQGAAVKLASPNAATTPADGLTRPGEYTFTVTVSDGTNTVSREVMLRVFEGNQPPIPIDAHNRIPVMVTLPKSETLLRGGGFDLEGDPLTFKWTVVKQPASADAQVEARPKGGWRLSGLTVPGDYVLRFDVSDPTHTVSEMLTVPVYPVNRPPVIERVAASPVVADAARLSAVTGDPDGDMITHWWSVKQAPTGARPVPVTPGARETEVSGLTVPGRYVFTLAVIDRTLVARRDLAVSVGGPGR